MRVQVDRVVVESVEVDFPDACPKCGADFVDPEESKLVRYDLVEDFGPAFIDPMETDEDDGCPIALDVDWKIGMSVARGVKFGCRGCLWTWVPEGSEFGG